MDEWIGIGTTGLEHQDAVVRVRTQAVSQHASSAAGADNDVVVLVFGGHLFAISTLIFTGAFLVFDAICHFSAVRILFTKCRND